MMHQNGTILARVCTSNAMLPIAGAAVAFTRQRADGTEELLAFRLTNYDGTAGPVEIETPDFAGTTLETTGQQPYTQLTVTAGQPGFDRICVRGVQVFSGTQSIQELMLVPTPPLVGSFSRTQTVRIPAQPL